VLKEAWANYRDESFILQFLSPEVIRRFRMFVLEDESESPFCTVSAIHEERGYLAVREALARSRDISLLEPDIQIVDADLKGDRVLRLRHFPQNGVPLNEQDVEATLQHLRSLWGHQVELAESQIG
jgi:stage V sporulation protein R